MSAVVPPTRPRPSPSRAARALHRGREPEGGRASGERGKARSKERDSEAEIAAYLRPVSDALVDSARRSADEQISAADEDALRELTRARSEAERLVAEARSQGESAAQWMAALGLTEARREAREMILGARRLAYETLRHEALAALERRGSTREGRKLAQRLESVVGERIGSGARVRSMGSEFCGFEARSHDRRVVVGPMLLVDHVIMSMTDEVQELWA